MSMVQTTPKQRTLARSIALEGVGLHSGVSAKVVLGPADPGCGIRFRRRDLPGTPVVAADLEYVIDTDLGTTLGAGEAKVLTVEHLLAALHAMRVDNAWVELDGPEVPIRDGSFKDYASLVLEAGVVEQDAEAVTLTLREPVSCCGSMGQSYAALPGRGLRISGTIDFTHPAIGRQYGSFQVDPESFLRELAPARTFGFREDAEALRARGLALGASLENAVVLDAQGPLNEGLRFPDEFLRHKVGDVVGDLALIGARLDAHIVAERPSHEGNVALGKAIRAQARRAKRESVLDVTTIMQNLPHRYPMLLVDRIVEREPGKRIVGIKNVTINEPFFQGHYPGHPVMPGVLIVEAMAQTGGLLLMDQVEDLSRKVVYFMTMDQVKWRRPVVPGDTLVLEVELLQARRGTCKMRGQGFVEGSLVAEAEFMARIMET